MGSILEEIRGELLRSIQQKIAESESSQSGTGSDPLLEIARDKITSTRTFLLAPDSLWNDTYVNSNTPPVTELWRRSSQVRINVSRGHRNAAKIGTT